jgi:hypothetical protein
MQIDTRGALDALQTQANISLQQAQTAGIRQDTKKKMAELAEWRKTEDIRSMKANAERSTLKWDLENLGATNELKVRQLEKATSEAVEATDQADMSLFASKFNGLMDVEPGSPEEKDLYEQARGEIQDNETLAKTYGPYTPEEASDARNMLRAQQHSIEQRQKLEAVEAAKTPAAPASDQKVNLDVPNAQGGFDTGVYSFNPRTREWRDVQGKVVDLPIGTKEEKTGRTLQDIQSPKIKSVEDAAFTNTISIGKELVQSAKSELLNYDKQGNLIGLNSDMLITGSLGVPLTEGKKTFVKLKNSLSAAVLARYGRTARKDEKIDAIEQLMPTAYDVKDPSVVELKLNIQEALLSGALDIITDGKPDLEASLNNAALLLQLGKDRLASKETDKVQEDVGDVKRIRKVTSPDGRVYNVNQ